MSDDQTPAPSIPQDTSDAGPTPEALAATQAPEPAVVNVVDPEGNLQGLPADQLQDALAAGYTPATQDHIDAYVRNQKYGGLGQQALTGLEGAGEGATFGLSTGVERALGVPGEDIQGRREENPLSHMAGQTAGLAGSALIGTGEGAALAKAGDAAASLIGAGSTVSKIGSSVVRGLVENGLAQSGDEVSKLLSGDPSQSAETAIASIGLSSLIGGGIGGMFGSVGALWDATQGGKLNSLLNNVKAKLGGLAPGTQSPMTQALADSGIQKVDPAIRAVLTGDDGLQRIGKILEQSDTTRGGRGYQAILDDFRKSTGDNLVQALGRDPESVIPKSDISDYETGNAVGQKFAQEYDAKVKPISDAYDAFFNKVKGVDLNPSVTDKADEISDAMTKGQNTLAKLTRAAQKAQASGDVEGSIEAAAKANDAADSLRQLQVKAKTPGTIDTILEKIGLAADKEGWTSSPSSDKMQLVTKIQKELPSIKNLEGLRNYIQEIGDATNKDPMNGPLRRAGGIIKSIMRDTEGEVIGNHIGSEEGAQALENYRATQQNYAGVAKIKDDIDESLHAKGSISGYGKAVKELAKSDGEGVWRKMSGTGDAALLGHLQQHFPETAATVQRAHLDRMLGAAAQKAKPGENINAAELLRQMNKLSPELKQFVIPATAKAKIDATSDIISELNRLPHNFSNTARTADALGSHGLGTAVSMAAGLLGHHPAAAIVVGKLSRYLSKDMPDGARLALLKFIGSDSPTSSAGFRAAAEYINSLKNGETLLSRGVKNVFKAGTEVLPQAAMPSDADRRKLDKALKAYQTDQNPLMAVGGHIKHYLPEHNEALAQTAATAVNYLNGKRPGNDRLGPLDPEIEPSAIDKHAYDKLLDLANQPLIILNKIQNGSLTINDLGAVRTMYPNLYNRISQKLMSEAVEAQRTKKIIPYPTRLSMSVFLGQPLDSTMTPAAIMAAQPVQPPSPQGGGGKKKGSPAALGKSNNLYKTAAQSAEEDENSREK